MQYASFTLIHSASWLVADKMMVLSIPMMGINMELLAWEWLVRME